MLCFANHFVKIQADLGHELDANVALEVQNLRGCKRNKNIERCLCVGES